MDEEARNERVRAILQVLATEQPQYEWTAKIEDTMYAGPLLTVTAHARDGTATAFAVTPWNAVAAARDLGAVGRDMLRQIQKHGE